MGMIKRKGSFTHRLLVWTFSILFGLFSYWLLGFVMDDIGNWPGPDYDQLEEQQLDQQLVATHESLSSQIDDTNRSIEELRNRQQLLKDSIDNTTRTMDQLLEIQRLSIEKASELSPEEQSAMAESIQVFLENQQRYQTFNDDISRLNEELIQLQQEKRENDQLLHEATAHSRRL